MLNPVVFTERVVRDFLRYQLTTYPFADEHLHGQLRQLLNLAESRRSPLLRGPYVSLSRPFRQGPAVKQLVGEGVLHPLLQNIAPFPAIYGHQEKAIRAIHQGRTTVVSTGTGSGKTEAFLYPIISRCLDLRDAGAPAGVVAVLVYPMNALAEDQLERLRGLLAGTGITFGMYVGKTPEREADVTGKRLRAGDSRAAYEAAQRARAKEREAGRASAGNYAIHPAEECCSRELMRTPGKQPRILLTNIKQLELILTRHRDVELFHGADLRYIVFDEAHTFKGAQGAETACLIRRLRTFCGRKPDEVTCIAASATMVDATGSDQPGRDFAARFFGVNGSAAEIVTEQYVEEDWAAHKQWPAALAKPPREGLEQVLSVLGTDNCAAIAEAIQQTTGIRVPSDAGWRVGLHAQLAANAFLHRIVQGLRRPKALADLCGELTKELGKPIEETEVLLWLTLGSAAQVEGRPLVRPVLHVFVRGIGGAVVTFPANHERPKLWLSTEDKTRVEAEAGLVDGAGHFPLPVKTCVTCGQHYFTHELAGFDYTGDQPGGGEFSDGATFWRPLGRKEGGVRVTLFDRIVSDDAAEEEGSAEKSTWVQMCRHCGTAHATETPNCRGCGRTSSQTRLKAVRQNPKSPGNLTSCLACGSRGGNRPGTYREPARPVRATTVSDVHVLGQNMLLHGHEERLLIFADNRQDAAFQAGWMRDHARRFRIRSLMLERLAQGELTVGDLAAWLDKRLAADPSLSEALVPEVWRLYRPHSEPAKHREEMRYFLRILVLREVATGMRQRIGLEPWGRMRVDYHGLSAELGTIKRWAEIAGVSAEELRDGIANLVDTERRKMVIYDSHRKIFSRFWSSGDEEVVRGYLPELSGVPKGLKLFREPGDAEARVAQWWSERGTTVAKQSALRWGVPREQVFEFLEDVWKLLKSELRLLAEVDLRGGGRGGGRIVAGTHGACQFDADKFLLVPQEARWECGVCRRPHTRPTPRLACMGYHCDGTISAKQLDSDNYDLALVDQQVDGTRLLKPREHSAQVPVTEREELERLFKDPKETRVNTLVCTPTLEMGVDIGGLDSVMMRNVPPLPANYWQRAGRAGRRNRMAVNLTYVRSAPHDQAVFREPLKLLGGAVTPPRFNLRNPELVRKHAHATTLTVLYRLSRQSEGTAGAEQAALGEVMNICFPNQVRGYLFGAGGNILSQPVDVSILAKPLDAHRDEILSTLQKAMTETWPDADKNFVSEEILATIVQQMPSRLAEVVQRLWRRLQWAMKEKARFAAIESERGTLDFEDKSLRERADRLIRRLKGESSGRGAQAEGVDDTNTYAVLASEGFLPGYGLDRGSVTGVATMPKGLPGPAEYLLPRPPGMALREYVPGNLIYANGHRFIPRFYRLEAVDPTVVKLDLRKEAVETAESGATAAGATTLPAVPICDVDLPHEWHIHDEEDHRFQLGVVVLGHELGRHSGGQAYQAGETAVQFQRGTHYRLVNVGTRTLVQKDEPVLGYPLCLVSGVSRSPLASQTELENFRAHHLERHNRAPANVAFYADVVADSVTLLDVPDISSAYSVAEGLRLAAAQILEMEVEDLQILVLPHIDRETVDAVIYDPMPGGSGLLEQLLERWTEVVAEAQRLLACVNDCATACLDCMLHFRNAHFERHLNRKTAQAYLAQRTELVPAQPIPAKQPATRSEGDAQPSNPPEFRLLDLLRRAGLGEPEAQKRIPIGQPWGQTVPDFFYPVPDERFAGVCIYLDGLSGHIHGNPETKERDEQIRETLREMDYEVIAIPKTALDDRDRMVTIFTRIARRLLTREEAERFRGNSDWFGMS